ncbi:MAG: hypothetical protein KDA75_05555 [Planctomycetaceae bacterium]|nr:hypothetical protein [Planctomycetaceae bacterium]
MSSAAGDAMSDERPPPVETPRQDRRKHNVGWIGRMLRRGFWIIALLLALIAGLPTLIARTGLRHELFGLARPGLPDGITIGGARLGWFAPVQFQVVTIPDLQGGPLLSVAEIRTDRPLWELVVNPDDVGRITVVSPEATIVQRGDGSNLGDVLARLKSTPPRRSRPRLRLELKGGRVTIQEESGTTLLGCEAIEALFDDLRQGDTPATASLSVATTEPSPRGRLEFGCQWQPAANDRELVGPGELKLQLTDWPLDVLTPLLQEALGTSAFAGETSLAIAGRWESLSEAGGAAELGLELTNLHAVLQSADPAATPQTLQTENAQLRLEGRYDGTRDRLDLQDSAFKTEWASGEVRGSIDQLRQRCVCDISGSVRIDLSNIPDLLPPELRSQIRLEGLETREIRLRGPLRTTATAAATAPSSTPELISSTGDLQNLSLETRLVWSLLEAFGVSSADAELMVRYLDQRVEAVPVRVPLSGGELVSLPAVAVGDDGVELQFAGGKMLDEIEFTPALCRNWMRYLSPLMANATTVEGRFTLSVAERSFPLEEFPNSGLEGSLAIHSARVGPGPLTQQILGIVQQFRGLAERRGTNPPDDAAQWLTIADQTVRFAVRDGRVEHRGLQMLIGPVTLESQGSVGIGDETLDLLLTLKFPESWFENRPLLAQMRGEGLKIPIRGTLSQPQMDVRPLRDFGRGIGLRAADGVLRRLLDRSNPQ